MDDPVALIRSLHESARRLAALSNPSDQHRQAIEDLRSLGFDRAALYLYDPVTGQLRGTWGTDEHGALVDESENSFDAARDRAHLTRAIHGHSTLEVWEDRDLVAGGRKVGRGWNAMVVLSDGDKVFGMLFVDNLLSGRPITPLDREVLALYGRTLSAHLLSRLFAGLSEKYRAQNAMKDKLFTILAHDLRGPIGNLSVMLGMACDQPMDSADLDEVLEESRQASLRTYSLLENVLGWVRGQLDEVEALRERLPVIRPLISVRVWLESPAKAKGVSLRIECPEALTAVADERMVETIVRNLVSNAVKYSPPGEEVVLRGSMSGGAVHIEVQDHGVGMTAEQVAVLFTPGQTRSRPGTKGEAGSGLGLSFSTDLARALGGRLEAESEPGRGSVFRLVLPDLVDGEL